MDIYLFKSGDAKLFRELLEAAVVSKRNGTVRWDVSPQDKPDWKRDEHAGFYVISGGVASLQIVDNCCDVYTALADALSSPLLSVRFQEKSFWDTSLYVGKELKLNFSTSPTAWGKAEAKSYFSDPAVLSEVWGVPRAKFERYLVDWGLTKAWVKRLKIMSPTYKLCGKKAYPDDECEYGDVYQGIDFIRALGGDHPVRGERFIVTLPPIRRV